ncbi:MAG TPA: DUF1453 domain-containing protein [Thermoanaerobaculia bacterium]|nr:DUF1453 domain-containing protein [Thermoanaerobaculia bacterium]
MPLLLIPLLLLALLAVMLLSIPLMIFQRYRFGTARRRARAWVISINIYGVAFSTIIFLVSAAVSNVWIPNAFSYAAVGFVCGCFLGMIGLAATRWEMRPQQLHYTPSRLLVLSLTILIIARLFYGFWLGWESWNSTARDASWLAGSGAEGSMGAGAVVLGYYLVYWVGVRRKLARSLRKIAQ